MTTTLSPLKALIAAVMNAAAAKLRGHTVGATLAPPQWLGPHTNPIRNAERAELKAIGKRQYKKRKHAARMAAKRAH